MIASVGLTLVLSRYLFETTPADPLTLALVSGAFVLTGALSCAGRAWPTTHVDLLIALRSE